MDVRILLRRLFQPLDLIQHLLAALRPLDRFLAVEGFELSDHLLLMADLPLLIVVLL